MTTRIDKGKHISSSVTHETAVKRSRSSSAQLNYGSKIGGSLKLYNLPASQQIFYTMPDESEFDYGQTFCKHGVPFRGMPFAKQPPMYAKPSSHLHANTSVFGGMANMSFPIPSSAVPQGLGLGGQAMPAPNSSVAVGGVGSSQASIANLSMTNPANPKNRFLTSGFTPAMNPRTAMRVNNKIFYDEVTRPKPVNFMNDIRFEASGMAPDTLLSNKSLFLHRWMMKPLPPRKHCVGNDEKKRYQSYPTVAFGTGFLGNQLQDPAFQVSTRYQTPPFTMLDRQPLGVGSQF